MITEFNQELPPDTIGSLTNMILTRSVDKQEFGLALLNIQSYVMGKLLTEGPLFGVASPTHDPTDEEALTALQSIQQSENEPGMVGGPVLTHGLLLVLKWAMKKFLKEYL